MQVQDSRAISVSKQALITLTQQYVLSPWEIPDMDFAAIINYHLDSLVFVRHENFQIYFFDIMRKRTDS